MLVLTAAIVFTLVVSAFCSLLEAFILSASTAEIEGLKQRFPRRGELLETFKREIEETSSALLALNTIANTLGSVTVGALAVQAYGQGSYLYFAISMTLSILIFSEILPKNVGVIYGSTLKFYLVYPILAVRLFMRPFSFLGEKMVRLVIREKLNMESSDEEILLLAQKSAKEGNLTIEERDMIANALSLDSVGVDGLMTPRTVVTALDRSLTIEETFRKFAQGVPFGRIPVYEENIDNIVGLVRRRDLLKAKAEDQDQKLVGELMQSVLFIPENGTAGSALKQFLKTHQQLAVVVDEYGSTAGVLTMEDIIEHLLGMEIFEQDDVAVDMRELARKKKWAREE